MQYDLDDEAMMFCFQYQRQSKTPRWVKIFSNHVRSPSFFFFTLSLFDLLKFEGMLALNDRGKFDYFSFFTGSMFTSTSALSASKRSSSGVTKSSASDNLLGRLPPPWRSSC